MTDSTATADTPLRQAWIPVTCIQAGGLAPRGLDGLASPPEAKDLSARIRSKRAAQAKLVMYLLAPSLAAALLKAFLNILKQ